MGNRIYRMLMTVHGVKAKIIQVKEMPVSKEITQIEPEPDFR